MSLRVANGVSTFRDLEQCGARFIVLAGSSLPARYQLWFTVADPEDCRLKTGSCTINRAPRLIFRRVHLLNR